MLVAQISDIHARPDLSSLRTLERAIGWLRTLRPDALVISGDLVDGGWRQGYRLIAESLRSLDCPVHLLPGNGDDVLLMRSELAAVGTCAAATGPMHFHAAINGLTLCGVDVTVAGQSYGDVLPHLPWLTSALADVTTPILLFMHQPPIRIGIEALDHVRCRNEDVLCQAPWRQWTGGRWRSSAAMSIDPYPAGWDRSRSRHAVPYAHPIRFSLTAEPIFR